MPGIGNREMGRTLVGAASAIVAAVLVLGGWLLATDGPSAALLVWSGAAAAAILMIPIWLRERYEIGEPLTFVLIATLVGVTLKAPYVYLSARDDVVRAILLEQAPDGLLAGMVLVLVGVTALSLGYLTRTRHLDLGRTGLVRRGRFRPLRFALVSALVLLAAAVAIVLFVREFGLVLAAAGLDELSAKRFLDLEGSQFRAALGYHRWAISLSGVLFAVALAWGMRERGRKRLLCMVVAAVSAAVAVGFAIFASSRGSVAVLIAAGLLIAYYMRGRLGAARVTAVIALAAAILVGITVLRPARTGVDWDRVSLPAELVEITVGGRHFLDLGKTSHVAHAVPDDIPLQYGRTLVNWVLAPIPRSLWPEKPAVGVGPLLGQAIYGTGLRGGVPPGFVAELFLNFHLVGVAAGMFALGCALRLFHESFRPFLAARHPNAVALYAMVVQTASIYLLTADFSKFVVELLTQVLPLLVIVALFAGRARAPA